MSLTKTESVNTRAVMKAIKLRLVLIVKVKVCSPSSHRGLGVFRDGNRNLIFYLSGPDCFT